MEINFREYATRATAPSSSCWSRRRRGNRTACCRRRSRPGWRAASSSRSTPSNPSRSRPSRPPPTGRPRPCPAAGAPAAPAAAGTTRRPGATTRGSRCRCVVGHGHVSLLAISDTWHSKLVRDIGIYEYSRQVAATHPSLSTTASVRGGWRCCGYVAE